MSIFVEDGQGGGYKAGITKEGQIKVQSENHELQHHISWNDGECYQIIGDDATVAATTQTILHINNDSTTKNFVVSYIRLQVATLAGGTAIPDVATYFQMGFGRTYSSGGTSVTPVNMNQASGNVADLTVYDNAPTLAGTFVEADRWYPDTDMMTFNKHGSLILGLNDTFEIRLVSDHTSGTAYCRVTGFFLPK